MSGCTSCEGFGITVGLHCVLIICNKCCTERVPRSWNHPKHTSWSSCTLMRLSQMRFFFLVCHIDKVCEYRQRVSGGDTDARSTSSLLCAIHRNYVHVIHVDCNSILTWWVVTTDTKCVTKMYVATKMCGPTKMHVTQCVPRCVVLPRCMLLNVYRLKRGGMWSVAWNDDLKFKIHSLMFAIRSWHLKNSKSWRRGQDRGATMLVSGERRMRANNVTETQQKCNTQATYNEQQGNTTPTIWHTRDTHTAHTRQKRKTNPRQTRHKPNTNPTQTRHTPNTNPTQTQHRHQHATHTRQKRNTHPRQTQDKPNTNPP